MTNYYTQIFKDANNINSETIADILLRGGVKLIVIHEGECIRLHKLFSEHLIVRETIAAGILLLIRPYPIMIGIIDKFRTSYLCNHTFLQFYH